MHPQPVLLPAPPSKPAIQAAPDLCPSRWGRGWLCCLPPPVDGPAREGASWVRVGGPRRNTDRSVGLSGERVHGGRSAEGPGGLKVLPGRGPRSWCPGQRRGLVEVGLGRAAGSDVFGPTSDVPVQVVNRPQYLSALHQGPGNGPGVLPPLGEGVDGADLGDGFTVSSSGPHPQCICGGRWELARVLPGGAICSDNWCGLRLPNSQSAQGDNI